MAYTQASGVFWRRVKESAELKDIRTVYYKLSRQYHPVQPSTPEAPHLPLFCQGCLMQLSFLTPLLYSM